MPDGRVVILSDYAGSAGAATGGAGHVVIDSYRALRDHGVAVDLVVGFGEPPEAAIRLGGGDLRADGAAGRWRTMWNRDASRRLREVLARHDPKTTVVILHQWTRYLTPAAVALLRPFPLMVYLHDHFWACPNGAYYHFPAGEPCDRTPLGLRCLTTQCDRAGRIEKLGRVARQVMLATAKLGGDRRLLLHLSERSRDVIAPLLPREQHAIVHNPLALPPDEPVRATSPTHDIAYVGRLEPEKGVAALLAAIRANHWSALFVGEGSLAIAAAATPGVTWRRWQPREEMAAAMRRARLVALPSLWPETWGLVVPEAMAAGVPVLASRRTGAAELVERFGGGALFDPDRPGDLARTAAAMLEAPPPPLGEAWPSLCRFLSPRRHAEQLVMLARHMWNIELAPSLSAPRRRAPTAA